MCNHNNRLHYSIFQDMKYARFFIRLIIFVSELLERSLFQINEIWLVFTLLAYFFAVREQRPSLKPSFRIKLMF